jgi:hypothetical protein
MTRTFQIALTAKAPLPLLLHSVFGELEEDPMCAITLKDPSRLHQQDFVSREAQVVKRLDARSKGLMEVYCSDHANHYLSRKGVFLPRTVGDFLRKDTIRSKFAQSAGFSFEPTLSLCHSILYIIKLLPRHKSKAKERSF